MGSSFGFLCFVILCVMRLKLPATVDMIILFQGYNGSQLWDAAFAVQAIISTNLVEEYSPTLKKAHAFVKNSQVWFFLNLLLFLVGELLLCCLLTNLTPSLLVHFSLL